MLHSTQEFQGGTICIEWEKCCENSRQQCEQFCFSFFHVKNCKKAACRSLQKESNVNQETRFGSA